jgi:DNA invertase Pin-like site-specific DNA recombinase
MTVYGYARVSTDSQSLFAQLAELKAAKCAKIFQEKISGARSIRHHAHRRDRSHAAGLGGYRTKSSNEQRLQC